MVVMLLSNQYFGRKITIHCNGVKITNDKLHIEFDVPFDDDHSPNKSEIKIYNLSADTRLRFKRGKRLVLNAGYEGDTGVILSGEVTRVRTEKIGTDRATIINVLDSHGVTSKKTVKKTYKKATSTEIIIKDLARAIGLKLAVLDLPKNKVQKKGYHVNGVALDTIQRLADDCGASFYFTKGQLYIRDIKKGDNIKFKLSSSTGLIGSPEPFEEERNGKTIKGYRVKALLQHRVNTAAILELHSKVVKGKFRVRSGAHVANHDFVTEMEVI